MGRKPQEERLFSTSYTASLAGIEICLLLLLNNFCLFGYGLAGEEELQLE